MAADVAIVYGVAAMLYMVRTRSMGTPLHDSLTASQRETYRNASAHRGSIFAQSVLVGILVVWMLTRR